MTYIHNKFILEILSRAFQPLIETSCLKKKKKRFETLPISLPSYISENVQTEKEQFQIRKILLVKRKAGI
jgi:hypothetical protein